MHVESLMHMVRFFYKYIEVGDRVLDVGSQSQFVGARKSYKSLLDALADIEYEGLDIVPGPNVDIVVKDPYDWNEIESDTYDIVISGQTFEHIEFFWLTFKEMARVLKSGGYICLIVPSHCKQHRYPVDCWRFLPDGMKALAKYAGLKILSATCRFPSYQFVKGKYAEEPNDTVGIFQKP